MKIVLPLAGKGTRLLPHTIDTPKPLMFIAGDSILDHLLDELIQLNPSEFVFITGYLKENLEDHLRTRYPYIPMQFIEQKDPQGLGHAIYQARDAFSKDEEMLVILGDQTFTIPWDQFLNRDQNKLSVVAVDDPSSFGIVEVNNNNRILSMEEKPEIAKSNLAISGTYYFPSAQSVFSALAHLMAQNIRTRGEFQITDAMRIMMDQGEIFQAFEISDWNDCGNHDDLLKANKTLLEKKGSFIPKFDDTVIIHEPVWIDETVQISHSEIGPYVSIAKGTIISYSNVSQTVLNENIQLEQCSLQNSYLGANLQLKNFSCQKAYLHQSTQI